MPEFVVPELCKLIDRPPSGAEWVHEVKFDGYRIQARVENGQRVLRTRKGLNWTAKFGAVAHAVASLPDGIYDGEVVHSTRKAHLTLGPCRREAKRGLLRCPVCFLVEGVPLRGFSCTLTRCPRTFIDIQPSNKVEPAVRVEG